MTNTPDYSGKKILFTAFSVSDGSEELAGYEYIGYHGATDVSTLYWGNEDYAAKIPNNIKKIRVDGNNHFDPDVTAGYDLIFRHQTTRPDLLKSPSTTNTNEFFKYCPAPIIAITGTKGKGTTSTLISLILDQAGIQNRLLGNMGNTAIHELDSITADEVVIFEISSFQLWDLEYSPHVAVVLMMDVDHQDVHSSVEEYIRAKSNIVNHQKQDDVVVYHPTNEMTADVVGTPNGRSKKYMSDEGAHIKDGQIFIDDQYILDTSQVGLLGEHNLENVCAAITAAWEYTQDVEAIATAVAEFRGLENRLELAGEKDGVEFYNDSFSVVPVATEAAIHAFDKPITLIVGGFDRGADFSHLAQSLKDSTVNHVLAIGATGERIRDELQRAGVRGVKHLGDMEMDEIVQTAKELTESNSIVLLSPGCASFDMFANYKDRGNKFKAAVENL